MDIDRVFVVEVLVLPLLVPIYYLIVHQESFAQDYLQLAKFELESEKIFLLKLQKVGTDNNHLKYAVQNIWTASTNTFNIWIKNYHFLGNTISESIRRSSCSNRFQIILGFYCWFLCWCVNTIVFVIYWHCF